MKNSTNKMTILLAFITVFAMGSTMLTGCGSSVTANEDIVNGGFENGDFSGWNAEGDFAFDAEGVVEAETVEGLDVTVSGKVGTYYFNGLAAANATSTGTLTSEPFKLGGVGKIGFKIGAGSDNSKCYVEFIEQGSDTVLATVANDAYDEGFIEDELVRVIVDLSEHIGKNIYIKITDNGTTQKSHEYFHLDDFVMYQSEEEVAAAQNERDELLSANARPEFNNDTPEAITVKNGGFEEGLNNWLILSGDAFTPSTIKSSAEKFWDTREYNADGEFFLDGFGAGEESVGAIRSTTFTLSNTGIISFLMSSANHNIIYAAVCNEEAIGDIEAGTELFTVSAKDVFKDNELSENMLRRYINAAEYAPEGGEAISLIGEKLYIKFVDNRDGGDFGAICFDDVRCSMTEEEVLALEKSDYDWAMSLSDRGAEEISYTQNYYSNYAYPLPLPVLMFTKTASPATVRASENAVNLNEFLTGVTAAYNDVAAEEFTYEITKVDYNGAAITEGFDQVVLNASGVANVTYCAKYQEMMIEETVAIDVSNENQVMNGGFETGDLTGWTVISGEINVDGAVSAAEFGWTGASYNHGGNYHFDGVNSAGEDMTYAVRSSEFVLGGAGVISFKLGGRAATLRVYDVESNEMLIEFKNTSWNDNENPHIEKGCRNLTMTTYYANLADYLGQNLYIELADTETSNWGVAHFDEINTYYEGETTAVLDTLAVNADSAIYTCEGDAQTAEIAWIDAN